MASENNMQFRFDAEGIRNRRNHARGMTIQIRGGRAGSRQRDGLMMVRRISSFDLILYLKTLQDGEHGVNGCEGIVWNY